MNTHASRRRRGTVLIMIVGALALMSVMTVIYFTIGRADRQASRAVQQQSDVDQIVSRFADYVLGVLSDDVVEPYVDGVDGTGNPILVLETFDYPSTDWQMRSEGPFPFGSSQYKFDPAGTYLSAGPVGSADQRRPSDPWLASTTPTWLNWNGDSIDDTSYLNERDWAHITDIAPDGRFVNLANLRDNFHARPGTLLSDPQNNGLPQMSYGLTLYDETGAVTTNTDFGSLVDYNRPADWSSRQVWAFRPAKGMPGDLPNTYPYTPNQWADADGDGMTDSRWFELTDASDRFNIRSLLPQDERYRYFFATRIIDLTGLVNVNSATDFASADPTNTAPTRKDPAGIYPSDIDLRRILTLDNVSDNVNLGYWGIKQPASAGPDDYTAMDAAMAYGVGAEGYRGARLTISDGLIPPPGTLPPHQLGFGDQFDNAAQRSAYYYNYGSRGGSGMYDPSTTSYTLGGAFNLADLLELKTYEGINNPRTGSRLEQAIGGRFNSGGAFPFGFSPLRDNRQLLDERDRVDEDGDGLPDPEAMAQFASDIRRYLTTYNGARQLITTTRGGYQLGQSDLPVDAVDALSKAADGTQGSTRFDDLFGGYADALLPYSDEVGSWNSAQLAFATLHYGYDVTGAFDRGPELALRLAAHLAVNMADAYDDEPDSGVQANRPTVATVLISSDYASTLDSGSEDQKFPWWNNSIVWAGTTEEAPKLRLDDTRLAVPTAGDTPVSPAVTVFGIEAQPFITEVATYFMYTDAMKSRGGDEDWGQPGGGGPPPPPVDKEPITIDGRVTESNSDFLIEVLAIQITNPFDEEIRLTSQTLSDGAVVSEDDVPEYYIEYAGKFYKLVDEQDDGTHQTVSLKKGETKVFYALSEPLGITQTRWEDHAGARVGAVNAWLHAQLGLIQDDASIEEPVRMVRFNPQTGAIKTSFNDLVDYDALSETGALPRSKGQVRLWRVLRNGTESGSNNDPRNDMLVDRLRDPNSGTTLDRRLAQSNQEIAGTVGLDESLSDPGDNTGYSLVLWGSVRRLDDPSTNPPRGAIPAYCLEAKWGVNDGLGLDNFMIEDDFNPNRLTRTDFLNENNGYTTFNKLFMDQAVGTIGGSAITLIPSITEQPKDKSGAPIGDNQDLTPTPYRDLYPEVHLDNDEFEDSTVSYLRVADMLSALAVGPVHDPMNTVITDDEQKWTTLSEALAMSLNYDTPGPGDDPLFVKMGDADVGVVDRGNLRLDDFIPFYDFNADGVFDDTIDQRRYPGIPLGLNVLNQFRTMDPEFGSLTQPTIGVVNINTAPLAVLRALPMLSPTNVPTDWWWTGGPHDGKSDIAATVLAYRDRTVARPRNAPAMLNFSYMMTPDDLQGDHGRFEADAIPPRIPSGSHSPLREAPGFASVAELMAVRDLNFSLDTMGYPAANDIDRLGANDTSESHKGVNTMLYEDEFGAKTLDDGIKDDYDEKLAIINALLNSVTVRSDVLCVWFVVHGYTEADVTGLAPEEPLTPSVARRYMMIVDRSNVRGKGDKPRVLLMQELPM
jgi:hypothetical protein